MLRAGRPCRIGRTAVPVREYGQVKEPHDDKHGRRRRPPRRRWLGLLKLVLRVLILALVTWGIWKTVRQAQNEFAAHQFAWNQVDLWWLCVAGVLYLAGLAPCWVFWHRTLWAMGQRPRWRESMRAHWIGHLGKYIPGKAMVVVLRTGLVYSDRVNRTVAATSVFIETLTMMAVGRICRRGLPAADESARLTHLAGHRDDGGFRMRRRCHPSFAAL